MSPHFLSDILQPVPLSRDPTTLSVEDTRISSFPFRFLTMNTIDDTPMITLMLIIDLLLDALSIGRTADHFAMSDGCVNTSTHTWKILYYYFNPPGVLINGHDYVRTAANMLTLMAIMQSACDRDGLTLFSDHRYDGPSLRAADGNLNLSLLTLYRRPDLLVPDCTDLDHRAPLHDAYSAPSRTRQVL